MQRPGLGSPASKLKLGAGAQVWGWTPVDLGLPDQLG